MKLFLIRHGRTSFNLKKRYAGHTDCPLDKVGRKQAKKISRSLQGHKFDKIYASDLKRAEDFAKIVFKNMPVRRTRQLREINFGTFEGLTAKQIAKIHPDFYASWLKSPHKIEFPKGEPFPGFKRRVLRFIKHIYGKHKDKAVAVVSHAGPIKIILNDIMRERSFWDITIAPASLSMIEYTAKRKYIKVLNDTSFL